MRRTCIEKLKQSSGIYGESKIFVAEDLSKIILQRRKSKMAQMKRLKEDGKKPYFVYPDRLCYRDAASGKAIAVESDKSKY